MDGIWGPRSQRAWQDYSRRQEKGDLRQSPYKKEKGRTIAVDRETKEKKPKGASVAVTPDEVRAEQKAKQEVLRRERVMQQVRQREAIFARAEVLRRNPKAAASMTLRQVSEVVLDTEAKMGLTTRPGATAVQTWLRSHGVRGPKGVLVKITGEYNKQTHDALEASFKRAEKAETRARVRGIALELYGRAGVKPGDKPSWFPLPGGIPTPAKLDAILQEGGFTANLVMQALLRSGMVNAGMLGWNDQVGPVAFNQWREAELRKLASKHSPLIRGSQALGFPMDMLWVYASIFNQTDLVPYPDVSDLPPLLADKALGDRARDDKLMEENAIRVESLRNQARALATADDPEDFAKKLAEQIRIEEKKYTELQKRIAAESLPWWGKTVNGLLYPGEKLRQGVTYFALKAPEIRHDLVGGPAPSYGDGDVSWRDAERTLDEMHPAARFAFEVAVDPLNFVHPLRVSSTMLKAGTRGATLGSYKIVRGQGGLFGRALVYEKGTWAKRGLTDRAIVGAIGGSRLQPAYEAMLEHGRKVAQLRETAVMKAGQRVTVQIRHGFKKPADPVAAKGWKAKALPKKQRQALDETLPAVESWLEQAPEVEGFLDAAVGDSVSLFVDAELTTYSNVGVSLLANLVEKARVAGIHQLATDSADDVSRSLLEAGAEESDRLLRLNEEYMRMIDNAGFYIVGGRGEKELAKQLRARTLSKMDEIEYVIIPALQRIIERRLATRGVSLWDEGGLWAGRMGDPANTIKALGRESFDEDVLDDGLNPAYGVPHEHDEMIDAIEFEVRRRTPRIYAYQARNLKAGTLPDGFDADVVAEEVREEIQAAWVKGADGKHYDTRETVKVSRLYGRQLGSAYEGIAAAGRTKSQRDLDELAELPEFLIQGGGVDEGMWRLMWTLGSRFGYRADIDHPTRRMFLPNAPAEAGREEAMDFAQKEYARGRELTQGVARAKIALNDAANHSLGWELVREHAYMVALAKAQSVYAKSLYVLLFGSMAVWRFATLPLRPGWVVRNTIDNTVKLIIAGVRDPRYFMYGGAGRPGKSVFDANIRELRHAATFLDSISSTRAAEAFDRHVARIWDLESSVLNRIFTSHGLVPVPESVLDQARMRLGDAGHVARGNPLRATASDWDRAVDPEAGGSLEDIPKEFRLEVQRMRHVRALMKTRKGEDGGRLLGLSREEAEAAAKLMYPESPVARLAGKIAKTPDLLWDMMASRPENYMKRVLYRFEYDRTLRRLLAERPVSPAPVLTERERIFADVVERPDDYLYHGTASQGTARDIEEEGLLFGDVAGGWELTLDYSEGGYVVVFRRSDFADGSGYDYVPKGQKPVAVFTARDFAEQIKPGVRTAERGGLEDEVTYYAPWTKPSVRNFIGSDFMDDGAATTAAFEAEASVLAHEKAWDTVVEYLFDYSKITVAEDFFKVFFPFIQFWRKNTGLWVRQFGSKPWLNNTLLQFDDERREAHSDLVPWMRRYIHADEIVDAAAVIPGLDVLVDAMLPDDGQFDPMSFASFAPLYRAYRNVAYGDNQLLPGETPGIAVLGPMLDAMNDWGLSMNPLVRKPLETVGIATTRSWQTMFPQTNLAVALTREFVSDEAALRVASWESAFDLLPLGVSSDAIAENFEYYVQQEIAGQAARGEELSRTRAEATIRAWFVIQNVWGYFGGLYWRRATPEDIYLSKLAGGMGPEFEEMTDQEKNALKLWGMRGMDRLTYDRYIHMVPLIEAYYRLTDPKEKFELTQEYPELRRYVGAEYRGKPWSGGWIRNMRRHTETATFFSALEVVEATDPAPDVREAALDIFASPELRKSWAANDTPAKIRDRQIRGEVHRYYAELNRAYFSIPDTDFEARNGFVAEHPELIRFWNRNNDPADDFEAIISSANAALREQYFDVVQRDGWDAAAALLERHPFMFEDTKSASKVDEETGEWKAGDGRWSAERQHDFAEAKPHLKWFFEKYMKDVGSKQAWSWLESSDTDAAEAIRSYLEKYPSKKRLEYMRASPWLRVYFAMPPAERGEWLRGDSEGAKVVRSFFEKHGDKGLSQHAKDYLGSKSDLDYYFSLPKEQRSAWLDSDDPRAKGVLAYFKKYGREHAYERLLKRYPRLAHGTPEQRKRLEFWRQFFALTPDKRPLFVMEQAEAHGVFIYGEFGETERHDNEQEWNRRAVGLGVNERQSAFLYVRPLLQFYRTLDKSEKPLFLRANPELQEYFDRFSVKSFTGDKKLDSDVESYFRLPPDSFARSKFLREHPAVQDWFDSRSSPAEAAMRSLLEQYFEISGAAEREEFLQDHPEIAAYFEQRREEKAIESTLYQAFDRADPRLRPFYETAEDLERAAEAMRLKLRRATLKAVGDIGVRRERRPLES